MRREAHYPARVSLQLSNKLNEEIRKVAREDNIAVGVLVRQAVERGWPLVRRARRRARSE